MEKGRKPFDNILKFPFKNFHSIYKKMNHERAANNNTKKIQCRNAENRHNKTHIEEIY